MAEIIDFNRGKEEEVMEISEFATIAANAAEELAGEKGPFNDADEADGFCSALSSFGMIICTPLANKEWFGYYASEEMPRDGVDAYGNNTVCTNLMDFINVVIGYGAEAMADTNGPLMNAKAADDLCDRIYYDANNKLCIPLANDWWLVYSVYEKMPENGISVIDIYRSVAESWANQNG